MSEADQSGAGRREVAYRVFAAEFDDADFSYSESDEDRAPNYVITPTGARANRLFVVGVLTEVEAVSEDVLRARVVDPTGAFVLYAGQYQPDEQAFLEAADPPAFVAVTGKARTFQPEDGDRIFTSIRPESISEVDAETRDRWVVQAAEQTVDRIAWMVTALASESAGDALRTALGEQGADDGLAHGISLALDHYGTTPTYLDGLREMALDAARVVAGERDEVEPPTLDPAEAGAVTATDLRDATTRPTEETPDIAEESTTTETPASDTPESPDVSQSERPDAAVADSTEPPSESTVSSTAAEHDETASAESGVEEQADTESGRTDEETAPEQEDTPTTTDTPAAGEQAEGQAEDDLGDFDPDEFELESETREQIEEEYGTDFQTGTEVDEPGEADIENPAEHPPAQGEESEADVESADAEPTGDEETGKSSGGDASSADESTADTDDEATADSSEGVAEPEDVQSTVLELMDELDDGSGADRATLIAEMDGRYGVDEATVEDAIEDALMEGQCYEPDDESLKPI